MEMAALLSQFSVTGKATLILSSLRTFISHKILQEALHMDLYSASADERETMLCFLLFQETREFPRKIQYPVTDLLLSTHLAQSESA
ncbi:hypothetical protein HanIR_Chr11g0542321 [Helianthus annuus]|nr:hypothetical protein HanIR_Chr11g0542321 [Helianthus annuus]